MTPKKSDAELAADKQRVEDAQKRLAQAKQDRDDKKQKADREFWLQVKAAIDSGELRQSEACAAIGYGREYVRRQLIEHTSATD